METLQTLETLEPQYCWDRTIEPNKFFGLHKYPAAQAEVALVLIGEKGAGKGTLVRCFFLQVS